jgi:hypothetical protein
LLLLPLLKNTSTVQAGSIFLPGTLARWPMGRRRGARRADAARGPA